MLEKYLNNSNNEIFKKSLIDDARSTEPRINYNAKFNLIGWFCRDVPRKRDESTFPGEYAISIKYFEKSVRHEFFKPREDHCRPMFYVFDGTKRPSYREVTEEELHRLRNPPQQPIVGAPPNPVQQQNEIDVGHLAAEQQQVFLGRAAADGRLPRQDFRRGNPFGVGRGNPFGVGRGNPFGFFGPRGGGDIDLKNKEEYYYSSKPESPDSWLFQVFFEDNPEEEKKYTNDPEGFEEMIKNYGDKQKEKEEQKPKEKINDSSSSIITTRKTSGFTMTPQISTVTRGGKRTKKYKKNRKGVKKISKNYTKKQRRTSKKLYIIKILDIL
jgi:hypothetical protein